MTKHALLLLTLLVAGLLAGCSKTETTSSPADATPGDGETSAAEPQTLSQEASMDACQLLTNEEIAGVQGEPPVRAQLVGDSRGQLAVSQCNFMLKTGPKSLTVRVVERGKGPDSRHPREVWQETFHQSQPADPARERFARKPQKVEGVGEEAFWLGNVKSGGLHVLKGNRYIRVNAGGVDDLAAKIEKCSKLAEYVLLRLDEAR